MGFLTGMEVLFFILGVVATLSVLGMIRLMKKYDFRWYATVLAALGLVGAIFTIAWFVSSIAEGEPQAATMGLLFFGIPVLILFGTTRRLVKKKNSAM